MINTSVSKNEHTIQSGVVEYSIGFPFYFNPDRTPQFLVKIGDEELRFNHNFELSEDRGSVVLRPTEEESWTLEGPEDFSWMAKWDGKKMLIERVVPFVQDSDYQLGRISSEQIERDFDLSVMRDQILATRMNEHVEDVQGEIDALHSRIDFVQEEHASDMATVDSRIDSVQEEHESDITAVHSRIDSIQEEHASDMATVDSQLATKAVKADVDAEFATVNANLATKATKAELETAKSTLSAGILRNEQAIQDTRDDMNTKDSQLEATLNSHTGELTTLRGNQSALDGRVSGIEEKIPESASGSNQLVSAQDLATGLFDLKAEIAGDISDATSPIQTQVEGVSAEVAKKQDKLTAGENITIVDNVISATGGGGGGASLPDQTDNAGKFLTTDGTTASWGEALVNTAVATTSMTIGGTQSSSLVTLNIGWNSSCAGSHSVALGPSASASAIRAVVVGVNSSVTHQRGIAIGSLVSAKADFAIQLGGDSFTENSDANTFKVGNANGNFEMMSADGTIPAERMSSTAGTTGQVLTKTDTGMAWQDASGGTSVTIRTWA